ncbi:MAG: hypothetical protein O3A60_07840 [Planctomycetota bacterium]|nr:hypothetical protein [Planctomycetota bacterium]
MGSFCRHARLSDFTGLPGFAQTRGERRATAAAGNLDEMQKILLDRQTVPLRYSAECRRKGTGGKAGFPHCPAVIPQCLFGESAFEVGVPSRRAFQFLGLAVTSFLLSVAALLVMLAVGIAIIVRVRSWLGESSGNPDRWESTLADYRNLRNKGVLNEEEYRKIRTLVEPGGHGSVSSQAGGAGKASPSAGEHRDIEGRTAPGDPGAAGEGGRSSEEDAPPLA